MKDEFKNKIEAIVRAIPRGMTLPYGKIAFYAGYPGAARAVGTLMAHNHDPKVPCHRVVRSDGKIGLYNRGGPAAKKKRLAMEKAFDKNSTIRIWQPTIKEIGTALKKASQK